MSRPADGGSSLSRTGLVELGTILTADDRLLKLENYGSLIREESVELY